MPRHKLRENAQQLRREATNEENKLWYQFLRTYPFQFKRQYVLGRFIADFFCASIGLIIELDGGQHFEKVTAEYDRERTQYLEDIRGFTVLRFSNLDVQKILKGSVLRLNKR